MFQQGKKFVDGSMAKIATKTDPNEAAKNTDLVIEAIVENIGIKQELFKNLDNAAAK